MFLEKNIKYVEGDPLLLAGTYRISDLAKVHNASLASLDFEFVE